MKDSESIKHLAIIMDGNGRWAKKRFLPKVEGHRRGAEAARRIVKAAAARGIKYLTLYTLSSENLSRPADEVRDIMNLLDFYLDKELDTLHKKNIRIKFIGDITKLKPSILAKVEKGMELTKNNNALTVALAVCYGGRDEIVTATKKIISDNIAPANITEELFGRYLFDPDMPDVDLMIRTSGEHRVSNFLLWQIVYAELYFADKYWPDFMEEDLDLAIEDFNSRKRYYGLR